MRRVSFRLCVDARLVGRCDAITGVAWERSSDEEEEAGEDFSLGKSSSSDESGSAGGKVFRRASTGRDTDCDEEDFRGPRRWVD
eukprot:CAMPEP_0184688390 /NCGR_PEP_ID=MMETSP0312-20130426/29710_1 /TAXON_ID=31354 /ORGANISM="Compsopogon coeruleus, Strain SAG 36.94" /LENGTH=83 /DNA_ID=CAMNT_0027145495 /DNA_START=37 /DNA_END=288 /DNA_ORIENTATION=-